MSVPHEIEASSITREGRMTLRVHDQTDIQKIYGDKPVFSPRYLNAAFSQAGPDAPVLLTYVSVSGPRRMKNQELSEKTSHDIHDRFALGLEADDAIASRFEDFPDWVLPLVKEYWPDEL